MRRTFQSAIMAGVIAVMTVAPACAETVQLEIKEYMFQPQDLTLPVGSVVVWTNHDQVPHTIAETTKKFRSAALDTGESFQVTFKDPGVYRYFCTLHPQMVGKITVTP